MSLLHFITVQEYISPQGKVSLLEKRWIVV